MEKIIVVFLLGALIAGCVSVSDTKEPGDTTTEAETTTTTEPTPEPETTKAEPETTKAEPEITKAEPETTKAEPEITKAEPEITKAEPETTEAEPETTKAEPETITPIDVSGPVTWSMYDGSVIPDQNSPSFGESNVKGEQPPIQNIIDEGGNKILEFISLGTDSNKFCWKMDLDYDPAKGATVIIRAKPIDQALFNNSLDIEIRNGTTRDRMIMSNNLLKLDKSGAQAEMNVDDWHIYRFVISNEGNNIVISLYVDEAADPIMTGTSSSESSDTFFRIGDGSNGGEAGCFYDWIIWTSDGARTPAQEPLPASVK